MSRYGKRKQRQTSPFALSLVKLFPFALSLVSPFALSLMELLVKLLAI
jgi:hypothetical protein